MPDDMPDEDHLDQALLAAARELGQCPKQVSGQQCCQVAGHQQPCLPSGRA